MEARGTLVEARGTLVEARERLTDCCAHGDARGVCVPRVRVRVLRLLRPKVSPGHARIYSLSRRVWLNCRPQTMTQLSTITQLLEQLTTADGHF